MTDVTVQTAPALSRLPGVELCQTGTWPASTGITTFTTDDFMAAVAALECPSVRRPCLKLGHVNIGSPGQPAIGYIDNMRGDESWHTLLGDFTGMPGWLATPDENGHTVLASAFPDRSIEGAWDFRCQMGHTHPFVITAVSLLGTEMPAVGTLASIQDIGRLYGVGGVPELVAAAAEQDESATSFAIPVTTGRKDQPMPNPSARTVAASVSADDVRRAFYESPIGSDWDAWIEEIQIDPLQIIYIDDDEGARFRVPVTVDAAGDGPDAVTFGEPTQVVIRYEDSNAVAASAGGERIRFASKSESRPGKAPVAATQTPAEPPVSTTPPTKTEGADIMSDTLSKGLRERLGVAEDADEATILAALDESLAERAEPTTAPAAPAPAAVPEGHVVIDNDVLEELRVAARAGQEARGVQLRQQRDETIAAAVKGGHIAPARREHWIAKWDADPEGVAASITELTKGEPIFSVAASGYGSNPEPEAVDPAAGSDYWFPNRPAPAGTSQEG